MGTSGSNTIFVGDSSSAPFMAFGDESMAGDGDTLVYAYVILRRTRLHQVESRLRRLKKKFGILEDMLIHCSKMMSPHQRDKMGIGHLKTEDIRSLIAHAVTLMNECSVFLRYGYGSLKALSEQFGSELVMQSMDGTSSISMPLEPNYKGFLGVLANSCMAVPPDGSKGPPLHMCQIFASEEKTPVRFIGDEAKRADSMLGGFSDIGAPEDAVFKFRPTVYEADKVACFQLADIAAYLCANALRKDQKYTFFPDQLRRVRLWASAECGLTKPDISAEQGVVR